MQARAEYRQAMAAAVREAKLQGIVIRLKCGKVWLELFILMCTLQHVFEEAPTDILLPEELEMSHGSLRKTKVREMMTRLGRPSSCLR